MNIHPFDVTQSAPNRGILHPHAATPQLEIDAERLDETPTTCDVLDCVTSVTWLLKIHQAHSRRTTDDIVLCNDHLREHRRGVALWVVRPNLR